MYYQVHPILCCYQKFRNLDRFSKKTKKFWIYKNKCFSAFLQVNKILIQ